MKALRIANTDIVMVMFHLDNWKKSGQIGQYLNESASMEEFDMLEDCIARMENIAADGLYCIFTAKDTFLWFSLFYKFSSLELDDSKFAGFLAYFKEMADGMDMNDNAGCTLIVINQNRENVGVMFGNPERVTGGRALKYYASVRLEYSKNIKGQVSSINSLRKQLQGFSKGGIVKDLEDAVKADGDSVIVSAQPGEAVLTKADTENLQRFTKPLKYEELSRKRVYCPNWK